MKLLLDTHCLIWVLTDAPQLGAAARRAIADAEGVWFSEGSIWELGLKWRKGKIALQPRRLAEQALGNGACARCRSIWKRSSRPVSCGSRMAIPSTVSCTRRPSTRAAVCSASIAPWPPSGPLC